MANKKASVKIYHGYGHTDNMVVYGHVFKKAANIKQKYSNSLFTNMRLLLKLFKIRTYPFAKVILTFRGQQEESQAASDGFFKFEFAAKQNVEAGWHQVSVKAIDNEGEVIAESKGSIYVPHITQYGFISDIDDTVMISYSATISRRLKELFFRNPRTRKTFESTENHYQLLATAHTDDKQPNPFFYVSSSEWNLYDYLVETFRYNDFPEGTFLLNQIKRLKNFFKTGKTGHEGKMLRIVRIMDAFPNQQFIFFGDNSQKDPEIYNKLAEKYDKNMVAVYIRNVSKRKERVTKEILLNLAQRDIKTCLFEHSDEAIAHSKKIGLIN